MPENDDETGFADLAPSISVRLAAGLHVVSGLYVLLSAVQLLTSIVFFGELELVQYLNWFLCLLGALQIVAGAQIIRMRTPWGVLGTALAVVVALTVTGWMVANISFQIFSCMQLGALVFAWAATMITPLTIGPIARASAARKKLEAGGMGLGL